MKNNLKYLFITGVVAIIIGTSCQKKLDEAYPNPNAGIKQPVELIFPSMIGSFVGSSSAAGSAYGMAGDATLIGRYIQYWGTYSTTISAASATLANLSNYDQMGGTVGSSDNLGSMWAAHYYGMGQNINRIIEWVSEEQKWDFVGAGYAIRAWGWLELASGAYQLQRERPAAALVHFKRAWRIWRPWGTDTIKETEQLEARREKTRAGLWLGEAWARVMSDRAPQATHAVLRAALAEIARIQAYDLLQETLMQQATLPPAPPGSPAYQQPVPYI